MTVVVFGASSQIGYFLLPRLLAQGAQVIAISRRQRASDDAVTWLQGRLPEPVPSLPPLSAVISFAPLTALAQWLESAPLVAGARIVATSSMSAQSKEHSVVEGERALAQQLRDGELALAAVCDQRGLPWTILRPTIIYGAGLDKSLTPIARRAMRYRVFLLVPGNGLRQPVHADDVASAALAILSRPDSAGHVLPIGGGERLPASTMFARVRASLPVATLALRIPAWLVAWSSRWLPRLRGPLTRLNSDLIADNTALSTLLGIEPRAFKPDAACWSHRE